MTQPSEPSRPNSDQPSVAVSQAEVVDDELVDAFARLIPQLSSSSPAPDEVQLRELVDNADTALFLARVDGEIIGSLTLAFYRIPTGLKAWIENFTRYYGYIRNKLSVNSPYTVE